MINNKISEKTKSKIQINNISPLRYPGGKTRACKILDQVFSDHFNIITLIIYYHLFLAEDLLNFFFKINIKKK